MAANSNNTRLIVCITLSVILCTIILDRLVMKGIFLDGVTYAAISRNLAIGKGTLWELYYRNEWAFSEHPPLMFGIQALFFKIFGDNYLTEKIYTFVVWLSTVLLIISFWRKLNLSSGTKYSFIIPVLLWTVIPTVTWSYTNNILDTTMALFCLAAVYTAYTALSSNSNNKTILLLISGLLTFAATFTKGPVGLFPVATPFIYTLIFTDKFNFRKTFLAALQSLSLVIIVIVCYVILYQFPDAKISISRYLNQQLFAALSGNREVTTGGLGRFNIVIDLLRELLIPISIALIIFILYKLGKPQANKLHKHNKLIIFFFLMGIAASLPIMLSVKQRSFYLISSLPFYILSLSLFILPYYIQATDKLKAGQKAMRKFFVIAFVATLIVCFYLGNKVGKVGRDHQLIEELEYISNQFPKDQVFGICPDSDKDYLFLAYLQRNNRMEVNPVFYTCDYVLVDKRWCDNDILPIITKIGYTRQAFDLPQYELYKRKPIIHFDFNLLNPAFPRVNR